MSTLTIQLPDSLHGKLREFAEAEGTSVEQLVVSAAGEKLAALLEGAKYLRREAKIGARGPRARAGEGSQRATGAGRRAGMRLA